MTWISSGLVCNRVPFCVLTESSLSTCRLSATLSLLPQPLLFAVTTPPLGLFLLCSVLPWCLPFGQQSSRAAVTVHDRPSINAELFDESPCGACAGADVLMILTCSADLTCTLSFTATRYLPPLYATRGSFGPGNI